MSIFRADRLATLLRGLRAADVAQDLGISASALSLYRRGKREPRLETLHAMCQTFGVTADWLLGMESSEAVPDREPTILLRDVEEAVQPLSELLRSARRPTVSRRDR